MAKTETKANWLTIDPASLPVAIAKQYVNYKDAYKEMKAERVAFEEALSGAIAPPKGKRVVFGYNFGKLSIAIVEDDKPKAAPGAISLASLMAR